MKLWDDLLENAEFAWNHWGFRTLSFSVVSTVAKSVYYLAELAFVIPKAVVQITTPPATLTNMSEKDFKNKYLERKSKKLKINGAHYFLTDENFYFVSDQNEDPLCLPLKPLKPVKEEKSKVLTEEELQKFKEEKLKELKFYFSSEKPIEHLSFVQIKKIELITGHSFQGPLQRVVSHAGLIVVENMIPVILVLEANRLIQNTGNQLINSSNNTMPYVGFGLKCALMLLNAGVTYYKISRDLTFMIRENIVMLEMGKNYPSIQNPLLKAICEKNKCSVQRVLGGVARDAVVYKGVNMTLHGFNFPFVGHIPGVSDLPFGRIPAEILSIQLDGDYIIDQIMPLCARDLTIYKKTHPELVWGTGLINWLITQGSWVTLGVLLNSVFSVLGVNKETGNVLAFALAGHLREVSKPLMRLFTAFLASNIQYPTFPSEEEINNNDSNLLRIFNPLMVYKRFLEFGVDSIAIGLKATVPKLFPPNKEPIQWKNLISKANSVLEHPLLHKKYPSWILLPEMFQSKEKFIRDVVVKHNWELLQRTLLDYLLALEAIRSSKTIKGNIVKSTIKVASKVPSIPSSAAWLLVGLPPNVTKLVIELLANHHVTIALGDVRRLLEHLHTNDVIIELPQDFQGSIQNQRSLMQEQSIAGIYEDEDDEHEDEDDEQNLKTDSQLVDPRILFRNTSKFDFTPTNANEKGPIYSTEMNDSPLRMLTDSPQPLKIIVMDEEEKKIDEKNDLDFSCVELHNKEDKGCNQVNLSSNSASVFNSVLKKEIPVVSKNDAHFTDEDFARMMIRNTLYQRNNN